MIEQLKTIRCIPLESCAKCPYSVGRQTCSKAQRDFEGGRPAVPPDWCPLPALHPPVAQLEAMVVEQEPVAWVDERAIAWLKDHPRGKITTTLEAKESYELYERPMPLYTAAPVAQQYEAGDMASAAAQGFRDGVASVTQQPLKLEDVEQYRMQMAGISTAAIGYWKECDSIHPDYDTLALRDVAKLYAKYDALYKAQQPQAEAQDVGQLEYRGNSVAYIHQKMTAYRSAIDAAWQAMRDAGHPPDGCTPLAQAITKALAPQQAEAVLIDGIAYNIPAPVAAELLRLHIEARQPQAEPDDEILKERDDAEDFIDMLLDEVLGTDRPEWTSAYGRDAALRDVQERMTALHKPTVDKAWARFERAQQQQAEAVPWDRLPGLLIDRYEGETLTEELLQTAMAEVLQAAPQQAEAVPTDALHTFLDAAAGEGLVLDGVDAADLYIKMFPERYAAAIAQQKGGQHDRT